MISNWLLPVKKIIQKNNQTFFTKTYSDDQVDFPDLEDIKVVLIGQNAEFCNAIRMHFKDFYTHFTSIAYADIGNVRNTDNQFLIPLISELLGSGIIPIVVGSNIKLTELIANQHKFNVRVVSNKAEDFIHEDDYNINYTGFQRHLVSNDTIQKIEDNSHGSLSLGKMRSHPSMLEPVLRDTQLAYINVDAVRLSEAPNSTHSYPSGMNTEEMCQVMKYIGLSNNLKAVMIDINNLSPKCTEESCLIAESLWYLLEGLNVRITDHPNINKDFHEFLVSIPEYDDEIVFVKSNHSNKWWLKVEKLNAESNYIACSFEEYQQTINAELPDRLLKLISE